MPEAPETTGASCHYFSSCSDHLSIDYHEVIVMQCQFGRPSAMACVRGKDTVRGVVRFYRQGGGVLVVAEIFGLPGDGFHAFHIHTGESCGGVNFADSLGHFNPGDVAHPDHAGDLPPLLSCNGRAFMTVLTDRFCIGDVIGKTVIIHSMPDDFTTPPAGNAGEKIACGIINKC